MGPSGFVEGFSEKGKIANLHESGGPTIISGGMVNWFIGGMVNW